jgi:hypothetical protein
MGTILMAPGFRDTSHCRLHGRLAERLDEDLAAKHRSGSNAGSSYLIIGLPLSGADR